MEEILIRTAVPDDAACIARLSGQLGYPSNPDVMHARLTDLSHDPTRAAYVALRSGLVAGWIEIAVRNSLESGSFSEILGLVVDESARRSGIGAALLAAARKWTKDNGQARLRVRTNIKREDAAKFYVREGFRELKQQRVFDRDLST